MEPNKDSYNYVTRDFQQLLRLLLFLLTATMSDSEERPYQSMDFDAAMPDSEEPEHLDEQMGPPPIPKGKGRATGDDDDKEEDEDEDDEDEDEEDEDMGRKGKKRAKVWIGLVLLVSS